MEILPLNPRYFPICFPPSHPGHFLNQVITRPGWNITKNLRIIFLGFRSLYFRGSPNY
jgi:hypothetical protein